MFKLSLIGAGLMLLAGYASAAEPTREQLQFFENKIRPLLSQRCYKCHSHESTKIKGGLSLEYRETMLKGGDSGPAIVPGDPEKSLLIKAVRYSNPDLQMPPKGEKLSPEEITALETWIKMGAPDPRTVGTSAVAQTWTQEKRDHWAFKPIKKMTPPTVQDPAWGKTPVDNFILAKLDAAKMKPAVQADKRALIRRATFDLIGLPPTPKEVEDFVADNSPDAFSKVIDRLLASPQYGERWGRHWLDVARYSDTKGDIRQQRESNLYPHAWTYRDYVIKSLNDDKPFSRFVLEQIAGDKFLPTTKPERAALGFLTLGDRFNGNNNDIINDRIDVVSKGFMGLTVTCARCHDHKFDPISQKDYYALHGVFASSSEPEFGPFLEPYFTQYKNKPEYLEYAKKFNELYQELDRLEEMPNRQKTKQQRDREGELRKEIARLELKHEGAPPRAMLLHDSTRPKDSPVFIRGEAENRGDIVPRRFLELFAGTNQPPIKSGSGRLELASAIVHPKNPLTPRVIVNRVWLHHFGQGIVQTPDDFGTQSEPPSHPELLDYLASRFMEEGWSLKKLHRLIMLSSVYQQSCENDLKYAERDPQNRLLWRANIRRLEFEAVRDSMLALGGQLDLTMGGRPVDLGQPPFSLRRTLYGSIDRRNLPEIYNQFDFANPDLCTGRRYETSVPQQALFMMNSPLVAELARRLVDHDEFQLLTESRDRVCWLYTRIYQRQPTAVEIKVGLKFVENSPDPESIKVSLPTRRNDRQKEKKPGRVAMSLANIKLSDLKPLGAWEKYAHALLQANETMFIN
jgi:hypothetical protein